MVGCLREPCAQGQGAGRDRVTAALTSEGKGARTAHCGGLRHRQPCAGLWHGNPGAFLAAPWHLRGHLRDPIQSKGPEQEDYASDFGVTKRSSLPLPSPTFAQSSPLKRMTARAAVGNLLPKALSISPFPLPESSSASP